MDEKEYVGEIVGKIRRDEKSKVLVILLSYAIIEPVAVMVEITTTTIARATVLGALLYIGITNDAVVLDRFLRVWPDRRKLFFIHAHLTLF